MTMKVSLVILLIMVNVQGCTANCQTFYQRLIDKSVNVSHPGQTEESFRLHWTSICKNENAISDSYNLSIAIDCAPVSTFLPYYVDNSTQREAIRTLCSDIDGLTEYFSCLIESSSTYVKVQECLKQIVTGDCKTDTCIADAIDDDVCNKPANDFIINTRKHCLTGRNSTTTCMECAGVKTTSSVILAMFLLTINLLFSAILN